LNNKNVGFLNISWWVWGGLALIVGLVYVFFVPKAELVHATQGINFIIVRWFHSLVWLLLAISFFMRAAELPTEWSNSVAIFGGVFYLVYLIAFSRLK